MKNHEIEPVVVLSDHVTENAAMRIPERNYLEAGDERIFSIIDWCPEAKLGDAIVVNARLLVKVPKGTAQDNTALLRKTIKHLAVESEYNKQKRKDRGDESPVEPQPA